MSRYGGFRKGKSKIFQNWTQMKTSAAPSTAPTSIQDFKYTDAKGIWDLNSTYQFPKGSYGVYDSFTNTNGTSITAHTPDFATSGASYTSILSTYNGIPNISISSNRLTAVSPISSAYTGGSVINSGLSNCIVRATVSKNGTSTSSGGTGLLLRANPTNDTKLGVDYVGSTIRLQSHTGATGTSITSATFSNTNSAQYEIKAVLNGTSIKIYVNDTLYIDTTSSFNVSETHHGVQLLGASTTTGTYADNFYVEELP